MSFKHDIERASLPERGCKSYVYDDDVKGLAVRITSSGHKSYVVRILNRNTGKHEYTKIGDVGSLDLKTAREIARIELGKLQTTLALGLNPNQERKKQAANRITLRQALEKYIGDKSNKKMQKHLSEAAQKDYKSCITVSRQGGDEFLYLLLEISDAVHIETIVKKIIDAIEAPCKIRELNLVIRPSIGIAT